jgi:hypothetical protein
VIFVTNSLGWVLLAGRLGGCQAKAAGTDWRGDLRSAFKSGEWSVSVAKQQSVFHLEIEMSVFWHWREHHSPGAAVSMIQSLLAVLNGNAYQRPGLQIKHD